MLFGQAMREVLREVFVHKLHDADSMREFWDFEPLLERLHYTCVSRHNLHSYHVGSTYQKTCTSGRVIYYVRQFQVSSVDL